MTATPPLFTGKYHLVSWNEPVHPVPPEEKGVRYLANNLTTSKEVELELKLGQLTEDSWPLEGTLRVSPSQWFRIKASVALGLSADAAGALIGNKHREAWFNAHHENDRIELWLGYRDAKQKTVPVQIFCFQPVLSTESKALVTRIVDPGAALAETWTSRLRGTRISYMRNNDFQRDYSGGSFYWESGWDIYLCDDATFKFHEGARTLAGQWGVVARNRNIYLELTSTEENLSYRIKHDGSYLTLNSLVCSWSRFA